MEIKPQTVKQVAYPVLAATAAALALSACQQQQTEQGHAGAPPVQLLGGYK
ncbi:MAG: hypothetical protein Q4C88_08540 [Akkermansia sp.]|nr:hypothetical protein [Akkermansia sp.]